MRENGYDEQIALLIQNDPAYQNMLNRLNLPATYVPGDLIRQSIEADEYNRRAPPWPRTWKRGIFATFIAWVRG